MDHLRACSPLPPPPTEADLDAPLPHPPPARPFRPPAPDRAASITERTGQVVGVGAGQTSTLPAARRPSPSQRGRPERVRNATVPIYGRKMRKIFNEWVSSACRSCCPSAGAQTRRHGLPRWRLDKTRPQRGARVSRSRARSPRLDPASRHHSGPSARRTPGVRTGTRRAACPARHPRLRQRRTVNGYTLAGRASVCQRRLDQAWSADGTSREPSRREFRPLPSSRRPGRVLARLLAHQHMGTQLGKGGASQLSEDPVHLAR